ncbi:hypothetical protein K353_06167 [Kitasatospora sp. SolWspMP-SS2h]|uniref:hypothetical protein n=1 Tax=Kitasatospora sp. SolWspMP-SS2h TaxID=1305729 RepID=UPI000DBFEC21|nr:hypothetical protein [Kitasatospora sp. SolWspMP-SS2h]RAJ31263.1 hypothetical protein K353_06167 [Kitasatospora sp. SolWspMP-SS2h]
MSHHRTILATLTAAALTTAGMIITAAPASATPTDLECTVGSQVNSYSPPLTNTTRSTTVSTDESFTCASLTNTITSGTSHRSGTFNASCLLSLQPPTASQTAVYRWNNGTSSTITYVSDAVVTAANGSLLITKVGAATAGVGIGQNATEVVAIPQLSVSACAGTGITAQTGLATLEIAPA